MRRCHQMFTYCAGLLLCSWGSTNKTGRMKLCSSFSFPTHIPQKKRIHFTKRSGNTINRNSVDDARSEAEELFERAKRIRESIPISPTLTETTASAIPNLEQKEEGREDDSSVAWYRLNVDIGRESGTWMDPRWGASGNRIEFTVDVGFGEELASDDVMERMVKDNFMGKSSDIRVVKTSDRAKLRNGFDSMKCYEGGYRIDGQTTVRFHISCNGKDDPSYGDISIPAGELHFSVPCFMNNINNLSSKEAPVTVREKGWHTGWYREESRIVGLFRAKPLVGPTK